MNREFENSGRVMPYRIPPQSLEPLAYSVQMEMTIVVRNNLLALTSYEWLRKICRNMPTHKIWEDEEFRKKAIELHEKADHEKAIHVGQSMVLWRGTHSMLASWLPTSSLICFSSSASSLHAMTLKCARTEVRP